MPDGKMHKMSGLKATDFITPVNLSIPVGTPGKITINYWPEDCGGIGGYWEGRTLEIIVPAASS